MKSLGITEETHIMLQERQKEFAQNNRGSKLTFDQLIINMLEDTAEGGDVQKYLKMKDALCDKCSKFLSELED